MRSAPEFRRNVHGRIERGQIASARSASPNMNAKKHIANTEWLSDAPKYCQNAASAPGESEENNIANINNSPKKLAVRVSKPRISPNPIANSPYATLKATSVPCGTTKFRSTGNING